MTDRGATRRRVGISGHLCDRYSSGSLQDSYSYTALSESRRAFGSPIGLPSYLAMLKRPWKRRAPLIRATWLARSDGPLGVLQSPHRLVPRAWGARKLRYEPVRQVPR